MVNTTDLRRIVKAGFLDFSRNVFTSLASVLIFTITLSVIAGVLLGGAALDTALRELKDKVDINVYIEEDVPESDIMNLRERIAALPGVREVSYVSREEAFFEFKQSKANDYLVLQSLEELGFNPLLAELNIKASDPSQYERIASSIEEDFGLSATGESLINKINYRDNQAAIDRLAKFISLSERVGVALSTLFIFIAVAVAFNTITLVIFTSRDEIGVMRLVGAGNEYIRGPFVVAGLFYGLIASVITVVLFYPLTKWVSVSTENFYGGIDLYTHYVSNFFEISAVVFVSGALLGVVSSALAVRRYLKL